MEVDVLKKLLRFSTFTVFENYEEYLRFASRFYNYDINNVLLAFKQFPQATQIAGYNAWKNHFHATIPDDTPAIALLIPIVQVSTITVNSVDEFGEVEFDEQKRVKREEEQAASLIYKPAYVFDVSQVQLNQDGNTSNANTPNFAEFPRIFRTKTRFTLSFVGSDEIALPRHKNYLLSLEDKDLAIRDNLSVEDIAAACIRAYVELLVHNEHGVLRDGRPIADFIAQAVAFVVNCHFGLTTSNFSFTYAHTFLEEDAETLLSFLRVVQEKAFTVIQVFDEFLYSFNEINLLNNLLTTPSREDFLDKLEEIMDNTSDIDLLADIHSLRNKVDMLSAEQFADLYRVRCSKQLYSQPVKYVKQS